MQDFFPTMMMKPNDGCDDNHCRLRQKEQQESLALNPVKEVVAEEVATIVHEENEWGKIFLNLKNGCFYNAHSFISRNFVSG